MTKPAPWLLLLLVTPLGACSTTKPNPGSQLEWRKASDFAPPLRDAQQNCRVQAAGDTIGTHPDAAVVSSDFVKCMRASGWALLDRDAK